MAFIRWPALRPASNENFGGGVSKTFAVKRIEKRILMTVAVHISGHEHVPGVETAFTENVSSRGARVSSIRRWRPNDTLEVSTLSRDFRSVARVTYCQPQSEGFVIGLEFLEPSGRWVVNAPVGSGKPLQG
jgi:hypothetical protein